jgi:hypothetical protein
MRMTAVPLGRSARSLSYELAKLSRQSEQHHLVGPEPFHSIQLMSWTVFAIVDGRFVHFHRGFHDLGKEGVTFQDVLQTEKLACKHGSRILPILWSRRVRNPCRVSEAILPPTA